MSRVIFDISMSLDGFVAAAGPTSRWASAASASTSGPSPTRATATGRS
jgi:hypothetical protein